ncbi:MAG: hypothetical protein A3J79_07925 [Elusimicrobia bacterium RIFOXYB2_FULL_62_6]|nr:MAG: hypothetical protein A3J79_07925 [Elusimicrobia bacterium RIFOXYB2_FULL_62_6]
MKNEKNLVIASYGLEPGQITIETLAALKACDTVFSPSLAGRAGNFIAKACPGFKPLKNRSQAGTVLAVKKAFLKAGSVGYLTYGNPLFLNFTAGRLIKEMEKAGVRIRVLPAVSSVDSIINLLFRDGFSAAGLRLVDVSACARSMRFAPEMDTLFFLAGEPGFKGDKKLSAAFLKGLAKAYPADHPVSLIDCPCIGEPAGRLLEGRIGGLAKMFPKAGKATTVFVPALRKK